MSEPAVEKIRLGMWEFHVLRLADQNMFASYVRETRYPANLWSSSFAYLWAISQSSQRTLLWKLIDGLLVIFVHTTKGSLYLPCLPFGDASPDQLAEATEHALTFCGGWNKGDRNKTVVKLLNADQLAFLREAKRFDALFSRVPWQGIERHFSVPRLDALEGAGFANVRNRVRKFYRETPDASLKPFVESDIDSLLTLGRQWEQRDRKSVV